MEIMRRLVQEEEGQGMVEYALIIALISIVVVAAVAGGLTESISAVFEKINAAIAGETEAADL